MLPDVRTLRPLLALASTLLAVPALAGPDDATRIRELSAEIVRLKQELDKRRSPGRTVVCAKEDLRRARSAYDGPTRDAELVLAQLSGLGVSPVYEREDLGKAGAGPKYFQVKEGCSFLAGERITGVNGVPFSDRYRAEQELSYAATWRFTVEPPEAGRVTIEASRSNAIELGAWLQIGQKEALIGPSFTEGRENGFLVFEIGSGALARAGLRQGDLLVAVNDVVLTHKDAERTIRGLWLALGKLTFRVERDGKPFFLAPLADASRTP